METRNMSSLIDQLDLKFQELKVELIKDIKDEIIVELKAFIDSQSKVINGLSETIVKHESTISILQNAVEKIKNDNDILKEKFESDIDSLQQYSRRLCLRIDGVELKQGFETPEEVVKLVQGFIKDAGVTCPDIVIDRAHRVGPVYENIEKKKMKSIIVKFNNFRIRSQFYQNRKNLKDGIRVKIDLTKRNYNLLREIMDLLSAEKFKDFYVYSDINCRIKIVDSSSKESAFINSFDDVDYFLSQH